MENELENLRYYFNLAEVDYICKRYKYNEIMKFLYVLNEADDFDKNYGEITINDLVNNKIIYHDAIIEAKNMVKLINDELNITLINELTDEYKTFQRAYFMFKDCELPPVRFYVQNKNKKQYIKILKNLVKNKILQGFKNE